MNQQPAIQVEHATVSIGGSDILHDLSWHVQMGDNWFILGPNGAGKTTLVKMLLGYLWPRYGASISILGRTFGQCNLQELRQRISWVSPYLQQWTGAKWPAHEVVISGGEATIGLYHTPSSDEVDRAREILAELDCEEIADHSFATLSSGEQVKVLIGRALYSRPELLILDEACVHLDIKSREYLLETVDRIATSHDSPTVIFITQRIEDISPVFNQGLLLKNGKLTASGERDAILTDANLTSLFDLPITLKRSEHGRLWPIVKH